MTSAVITLQLTREEAQDLTQFFKSTAFIDFFLNSIDESQAHRMQSAAGKVLKALTDENIFSTTPAAEPAEIVGVLRAARSHVRDANQGRSDRRLLSSIDRLIQELEQ